MGEKTHAGSRNFLIGTQAEPSVVDFTSVEKQVTKNYPPTFLWWGSSDSCVDPDNSRMLKAALENTGIPCRCVEYPGVEHGVGLGKGLACEGWIEKAVAFWEMHK
jgi:acetyl esterase/lipase